MHETFHPWMSKCQPQFQKNANHETIKNTINVNYYGKKYCLFMATNCKQCTTTRFQSWVVKKRERNNYSEMSTMYSNKMSAMNVCEENMANKDDVSIYICLLLFVSLTHGILVFVSLTHNILLVDHWFSLHYGEGGNSSSSTWSSSIEMICSTLIVWVELPWRSFSSCPMCTQCLRFSSTFLSGVSASGNILARILGEMTTIADWWRSVWGKKTKLIHSWMCISYNDNTWLVSAV